MRTLVIDDDPDSHNILKNLLSKLDNTIELVGSAFSITEGIELIKARKPALLFLDIQLPDGLGFELLNKVKENQFQVIFITGFDEYAVKAFKFGAIDFLLKPIGRKALQEALEKVKHLGETQISFEHLQKIYEIYREIQEDNLPSRIRILPNRIPISSQTEIIFPKVKSLIHLKANEAYTNFRIEGNSSVVVSSTNLGKYAKLLEPYDYLKQVSRSDIINRNYVEKYNRRENMAVMSNGSEIYIPRANREEFKKWMRG
ncbi:MAG: response regulator transcription factor [Bacteroidota bacterium]